MEGVPAGGYRAEILVHWTKAAADDIDPLARETFSLANVHFQARRLFPKQDESPIGKNAEFPT
ncbi:hypothetical protein [Burkholderia sp. BCC0405]|uniref:hypothetical protein n=1 Tax=Burkholderia sp. BCC0405 TaxID=2676298 RepID=UPI00158C36C4|nr:hypothetical protein [Burkholderia sp. BCC0405]